MNTKLVMSVSALLLMAAGIACSFAPAEIVSLLSHNPNNSSLQLTIQILGAVYFGFGMTNWTAKTNLIGGIYARPIAIGNLSHYIIGSLAAIKIYFSDQNVIVLFVAITYSVLAILFAMIFFSHPVKSSE